jgi:glutamate synthase domain-containing protein 3
MTKKRPAIHEGGTPINKKDIKVVPNGDTPQALVKRRKLSGMSTESAYSTAASPRSVHDKLRRILDQKTSEGSWQKQREQATEEFLQKMKDIERLFGAAISDFERGRQTGVGEYELDARGPFGDV